MMRPNIFNYATSELSQDAFLCWFLEWASPEYENYDKNLHACSVNFINKLFEITSINPPLKIEKIDIIKQDNNIDVLCVVNKTYPILIEDKKNSKNHSGQLARYLKDVKSRKYLEKNIIPIYFKTEDQSSYSDVLNNEYQIFLRDDFIDILEKYIGNNEILVDYRNYLQSITKKVESYKFLQVDQWCWHAWVGFYMKLKDLLGAGSWDYVANPSGGFLGFWWHFQGDDRCEQYLQLEQNKLCFKIWVKNSDERRELRWEWYEKIKSTSKKFEINLKKPERFGNGNYMTVCVYDGEYRVVENGVVNLQKTVDLLKCAEKILESVRETIL